MTIERSGSTWDFFIAHAGSDTDTATALYELLEPRCRPFLDRRNLLLGDDWDRALAKAQRQSEITVVLVSSRTEDAYYQREEIAAAIALARETPGQHRVVPIYLDSSAAASESVPYGLRLKNGLTLSSTVDIEKVSDLLLDLLSKLKGEIVNASQEADEDHQTSATDLKYYVYVSPSKIDMLFSQMPRTLRRAIAKKRHVEIESPQLGEPTIYSKIAVVSEYLEQRHLAGTIDKPGPYFRGSLLMRWGPYGLNGGDGLVYFGAVTDVCILGLGGSMGNVIGSVGGSHPHSRSWTPALTAALIKELDWSPDDTSRLNLDDASLTLRAVELASEQMSGVRQTIEFVARKLLCWPDDGIPSNWQPRGGKRVLLGSPVFAALVDGL